MIEIHLELWGQPEIWLIPMSTVQPSQHRSATRYVNRQLPLKGRTRGDVGLV